MKSGSKIKKSDFGAAIMRGNRASRRAPWPTKHPIAPLPRDSIFCARFSALGESKTSALIKHKSHCITVAFIVFKYLLDSYSIFYTMCE